MDTERYILKKRAKIICSKDSSEKWKGQGMVTPAFIAS